MRRFEHPPGQVWDVVIGRASWGSLFALFVPAHAEPVRQAPLHASSQEAAEAELDALDQHALVALLDRSTPKDE